MSKKFFGIFSEIVSTALLFVPAIEGVKLGWKIAAVATSLGLQYANYQMQQDDLKNSLAKLAKGSQGILINTRSSRETLPLAYGRCYMGGNIVYLETKGDDNRDLIVSYAICEGPIDKIWEILVDERMIFNHTPALGTEGAVAQEIWIPPYSGTVELAIKWYIAKQVGNTFHISAQAPANTTWYDIADSKVVAINMDSDSGSYSVDFSKTVTVKKNQFVLFQNPNTETTTTTYTATATIKWEFSGVYKRVWVEASGDGYFGIALNKPIQVSDSTDTTDQPVFKYDDDLKDYVDFFYDKGDGEFQVYYDRGKGLEGHGSWHDQFKNNYHPKTRSPYTFMVFAHYKYPKLDKKKGKLKATVWSGLPNATFLFDAKIIPDLTDPNINSWEDINYPEWGLNNPNGVTPTKASSNPVNCLVDFLLSPPPRGIGKSYEYLDFDSFKQAALYCANPTTVIPAGDPKGRTFVSGGFYFNGAFYDRTRASEIIEHLLNHFRGVLYEFNGKLYVDYMDVMDLEIDPEAEHKLITEDKIADGSFRYWVGDLQSKYTSVRVTYTEPNIGYKITDTVLEIEQNPETEERELAVPLIGAYKEQALRLAKYYADRNNLSARVSITVSSEFYDLKLYDVVCLDYPSQGITKDTKWRVVGINYNPDYTISLELLKEDYDLYDDQIGISEEAFDVTNLPNFYDPPPAPTNLTVEEKVELGYDGSMRNYLLVDWDIENPALWGFIDRFSIYVHVEGENDNSGSDEYILNESGTKAYTLYYQADGTLIAQDKTSDALSEYGDLSNVPEVYLKDLNPDSNSVYYKVRIADDYSGGNVISYLVKTQLTENPPYLNGLMVQSENGESVRLFYWEDDAPWKISTPYFGLGKHVADVKSPPYRYYGLVEGKLHTISVASVSEYGVASKGVATTHITPIGLDEFDIPINVNWTPKIDNRLGIYANVNFNVSISNSQYFSYIQMIDRFQVRYKISDSSLGVSQLETNTDDWENDWVLAKEIKAISNSVSDWFDLPDTVGSKYVNIGVCAISKNGLLSKYAYIKEHLVPEWKPPAGTLPYPTPLVPSTEALPDEPSDITVKVVGQMLQITVEKPSDSAKVANRVITGYKIEVKQGTTLVTTFPSAWTNVVSQMIGGGYFDVTVTYPLPIADVSNGILYYYAIRAKSVNSYGESVNWKEYSYNSDGTTYYSFHLKSETPGGATGNIIRTEKCGLYFDYKKANMFLLSHSQGDPTQAPDLKIGLYGNLGTDTVNARLVLLKYYDGSWQEIASLNAEAPSNYILYITPVGSPVDGAYIERLDIKGRAKVIEGFLSQDDENSFFLFKGKLKTTQVDTSSTSVGSAKGRLPVYDEDGNLIGYILVYDTQ